MSRHQRKKARKAARQRSASVPNWVYLVVSAAVVLALGLGGLTLMGKGGSPAPETGGSLPSWLAQAPPPVKEAYAYAADNPDKVSYIPCYCGCGRHSGHQSVNDCFVAARGADGTVVYDPHGSGCDMCVDIVLTTKRMLAQGSTLHEVRQAVDAKYSYLGPPTDTPPIPQ